MSSSFHGSGELLNFETILERVRNLDPANVPMYATGDDIAGGRIFADLMKNAARFDETARCWRVYDGTCWRRDTEGLAVDALAKSAQRALFIYCADKPESPFKKYCVGLGKIGNRRHMIDDARSFYPVRASDFDRQPYLFNCQNCVIDLRDGNTMEHDPGLLLSKVSNVRFDHNARSERWEQFVHEVTAGDADKARYIQRILGYSLLGECRREELYIFYGSTTRNGKSTMCDTIRCLMGEYGGTCQPETLAQRERNSSNASGDLARLNGIRYLQCSEPPKRMIFDIALLKTITGRDSITCRNLYEREFEYVPQFKLVMNTNYLPVVNDDTFFASGRVKVVEFNRHFAPEEQDTSLKDKLREPDQLSGILNWLLEGLRQYNKDGCALIEPESVRSATEAYRKKSDKVGQFVEDVFIRDDRGRITAKMAYNCYQQWCRECGYGVDGKKNFMSDLRSKGLLQQSATVDGRTFRNVITGYTVDVDQYGNLVDNPFD